MGGGTLEEQIRAVIWREKWTQKKKNQLLFTF